MNAISSTIKSCLTCPRSTARPKFVHTIIKRVIWIAKDSVWTLVSQQQSIIDFTSIRHFHSKWCKFFADLTEILRNLGSYNEMAYVWRAWREASGEKMRDLYYRYIDLSNEAAQKNGN